MSYEEQLVIVYFIGFIVMVLICCVKQNQWQKKYKQMQSDYDGLIEQVKDLIHEKEILKQKLDDYRLINEFICENNELRNQNADT